MPEGNALALIAIRPGPLQDSLVALMTTIGQVNAVLIVEDAGSALRMMSQHHPALVVIEGILSTEDGRATICEIKSRWPGTGCIVLADCADQQREAEAAGADAAMLSGYSPHKLIAVVEELLS